jgi:hypothetical protein
VNEYVLAVLAVAATVYGASAGAKLLSRRGYRSYRAGLAETSLVPARRLPVTAASLAAAEAAAAGLAIAAITAAAWPHGSTLVTELSLAGAALLTSVLAAGVATVMRRGTRAQCACFGAGSGRPLGGPHLARNVGLLVILASGLIGNEFSRGRPGLAAAALAVSAGVVAGLMLTRLDDLIALFAPISPAGGQLSDSGTSR